MNQNNRVVLSEKGSNKYRKLSEDKKIYKERKWKKQVS